MLETVITVLLVTLFVLGLFGIVHWVLGFFPRVNSIRLNRRIGKRWIFLTLIVMWLNKVSDLLHQGGLSEWRRNDYLNVFHLCVLTYCVVFAWNWTPKPGKESVQSGVSKEGGEG